MTDQAPAAGEPAAPNGNWLVLLVIACVVLGASALVLAATDLIDVPAWLFMSALGVMLVAGAVCFVFLWSEARAAGTGLLRTAGHAVWGTVRLLWELLF